MRKTPVACDDRRHARRLATRETILDAAEQIVLERGFQGLRTKDLVERAGVSERTIFNHFENIEAVVLARVEDYLVPLLAETPFPAGVAPGDLPGVIGERFRENLANESGRKHLTGFLRLAAALAPSAGEMLARQAVLTLFTISDRLSNEVDEKYPDLATDQHIQLRLYISNMTFALAYGLARCAVRRMEDGCGELEDLLASVPPMDELIPSVYWAFDQVDAGKPGLAGPTPQYSQQPHHNQ